MINFDDFYKTNYTEIVNLDFNTGYSIEGKTPKRICRFCGQAEPETTFNKTAHAISELLGNKKIVLLNECDKCNQIFGEKYEPHLAKFLGAYRTIVGLNGKKGVPNFKSKKCKIASTGKGLSFEFNITNKIDDYNYIIESEKRSYVPVYAAKSLIKSAISILPYEYLSSCKETIRWVRWDRTNMSKFPLWISVNNDFLNETGKAIILLKRDASMMPYPTFIYVLCIKGACFQMTIPFCDGDKSIMCMPPVRYMNGKLCMVDMAGKEYQNDYKKLSMKIVPDDLSFENGLSKY